MHPTPKNCTTLEWFVGGSDFSLVSEQKSVIGISMLMLLGVSTGFFGVEVGWS